MDTDMTYEESIQMTSPYSHRSSPSAPVKKRLFGCNHANGPNDGYDTIMRTPNPKAMVAADDGRPMVDLIKARCSPVTSLAAELTCTLEIGDASSMDKTPRKSLLAELAQKATSSDQIVVSQPSTVADVVATNTSQTSAVLVEAQRISERPMLPKPKFAPRPFIRNNTASARLESPDNGKREAMDLFGSPPSLVINTVRAPLSLSGPKSAGTKPPLFAGNQRQSGLTREFELRSPPTHWNRRGPQSAGTRGINLAPIPLRKVGNGHALPRAPASAPPTVPIQTTPSTSGAQKRAAGVLDRSVLRSSPKRNFPNVLSLANQVSMMEDDDAMEIDAESRNHRNPPTKMRRTSSTSSFDEDEMAYVLPSPTGMTPVGFTMSQGILPCIETVETGKDAFKRISPATLVDLLEGRYHQQVDYFHVVDCRFPYEFDGGHIIGAVNISTPIDMAKAFFHPPCIDKKVVIVFHCEFSFERAPAMAGRLRKLDRSLNLAHYPSLFYPEVYILKGGYKDFYTEYKQRCFPQQYVEMNHEAFKTEYRQGVAIHKREFRKTKSFS
ncbi:hypothetical protein SeMB42_g02738 [Synchytrium endobioticum]|uniref:M-phase inducer phosphatase n=1 Tax=Synchytrium endobioticum TaxID=286115 RepID=A0A507DCM5_9FUNG|nr:hypothetical protein SeLEV6574_g05254 [Synchytrium endobioticum]TPX49107.1 hypothetical protein SeMB42_g02738 [Synchytrium endobioticum]